MRRRRGRTTSRAAPPAAALPPALSASFGPLASLWRQPVWAGEQSLQPRAPLCVHTGSREEARLTEGWAAECCDTEPHWSGARGPPEAHFSAAIQLPSWYLGPGSDPARSYPFLPG